MSKLSRPMLIVLSGLPATGKSQLGMRIARSLGIAALAVDPIESAIVDAGIEASFETSLAAYRVAEAVADSQLALGQSALIDAINAPEQAKALWRALAAKYEVPLRVIECVCSDDALHQQRLAARARRQHVREPSWAEVQQRAEEYTAWTEPVLRLDAIKPGDANAAAAIVWLLGPSA